MKVVEKEKSVAYVIHEWYDIFKLNVSLMIQIKKEWLDMNANQLQDIVEEALGKETIIIDNNEDTVVVKYKKRGQVEYAVLRYNDKGCFAGRYYTTVFSTEEEAKVSALDTYQTLING